MKPKTFSNNKDFTFPLFYCEINKTKLPVYCNGCSDTFGLYNNMPGISITLNLFKKRIQKTDAYGTWSTNMVNYIIIGH